MNLIPENVELSDAELYAGGHCVHEAMRAYLQSYSSIPNFPEELKGPGFVNHWEEISDVLKGVSVADVRINTANLVSREDALDIIARVHDEPLLRDISILSLYVTMALQTISHLNAL
jgi:hypothetical protein